MDQGQPRQFDVVISGANFTGQALALALAQSLGRELRIAIIDRNPPSARTPAADIRAFALSAASRHLLECLGVWPRIEPGAQPVEGIDITDSGLEAGIRPVLLSYDNHLDSGEPASTIVPAELLGRALAEAVGLHTSIEIIAPAAIASFAETDGMVGIDLESGPPLSARLLVAAEGRASHLREIAGIKSVRWGHGQAGIVTTVEHERPHRGRAVQHFLPGGPFAILPLTGNRSCITWSEAAEEARRIMALDDKGFLDEVDRRFGGKLGALRLDGPRQSWPLETQLARSYIGRRFVLVGDAAHGVHPIAGQGLNLGFRDVAALTEAVADAARIGLDIGSAPVLERYERWRRFDSWLSASAFDALNRLFSNDWTLMRSAREFGLGVVDRLPALKKAFVTEAAGLSGEVPKLLRGERA